MCEYVRVWVCDVEVWNVLNVCGEGESIKCIHGILDYNSKANSRGSVCMYGVGSAVMCACDVCVCVHVCDVWVMLC